MSEISSSPRIISRFGAVFGVGWISVAGPLVVAAAPPASASDNPAAPNTGMVFLAALRFAACFGRGTVSFSMLEAIGSAFRVCSYAL
jgi:hypothetical protein